MVFDRGHLEPSDTQVGSSVNACSTGFKDWFSVASDHEPSFMGRARAPPIEIPMCNATSSFADRDAHNVSDHIDNSIPDLPKDEREVRSLHLHEDVDSKCM